ncbi:MAG: radical SAM protein [Deltaproteobacteria bacterium]|nr:radical SAM protein [Deltaproteobacteria bacterium]
MRITFINPPIKLGKTYAHYPLFSNLGMLQNAALLEKAGLSVCIVDAFFITENINFRPIDNDLFHLGAELHYLEKLIKNNNSEIFIIPITMFSDVTKLQETYIIEICDIIKRLHRDSILIAADCYICGMNYFAYDSALLLRSIKSIDVNLKGETDITLLNTVIHIKKYGTYDLPYGTYRHKGEIIQKDDINYYPTNLNTLPYPAFHLLEMNKYFNILGEATRLDLIHEYHAPERFLPLMTSRGCLYSCNFCTQQVLKMPYRYYSNEYLIKEIRYFKNKYKVDRFLFLDNNINAESKRFDELVTFLSNNNISWDAVNGFRADKLKRVHIKKIKAAGNKKLTISAESGDPELLNNVITKNLKLQAVINVAKWTNELKFPSQIHYIIGMPGENIEKMNKTLEFAEMLFEKYKAWPLLQHAIPFRNTSLYNLCKTNNYFAKDPDKTPTHILETHPIIRTTEFSERDVLTIKKHFINKFKFYETTSYIITNNSCNNNCLHCEISDRLNKKSISKRKIKCQIQTANKNGQKNLIIIGGEPTINNENLFFALKEAKRLGFQNIVLTTNGRMLAYREFTREILRLGINQISISINSMDSKTHDHITSVNGSFTQTISGIQNLLYLNFKNININIRVTSINQNHIEEIIKILSSSNIHNFYIRIALPLGKLAQNPSLLPDLKSLSSTINRILEKYRDDLNIQIKGLPYCLIPERFLNNLKFFPLLYANEYRRLKVKIPKCISCVHYISCLGFFRPEFSKYYNQEIQ